MNPRQIFNDHLLVGKKLTIAFPDRNSLLGFRTQLTKIKRAMEESTAKLGFELGTEEQSIRTKKVEGTELTYEVWLGEKDLKPASYTILTIKDGTEPE